MWRQRDPILRRTGLAPPPRHMCQTASGSCRGTSHQAMGLLLGVTTFLAVTGCAGAAPPGIQARVTSDPGSALLLPAGSGPARTLTMAFIYEPNALLPKVPGSGSSNDVKRLFNAALGLVDSAGTARPYLAETLPQLNTASWQVFPDGRMETSYRLRPNLTWQDGEPLTATDFVFAWRVYRAPGLGLFDSSPQDLMEEVQAPDARTVVIRWATVYPDAGIMSDTALEPLPGHLLEAPLGAFEANPSTREALVNHPYWSTEFVGAGPFRLTSWTPGLELQAAAFAGHALGRPKIERVVAQFLSDSNTILTNVLAGTVQFTTRNALFFEHAQVLKRDWGSNGAILFTSDTRVINTVQFRPEYLREPALADVRVRRAIAHAIDRQALQDGLYDGEGQIVETTLSREVPYYPEVDRALVKYPYDPRRTEQLLNEAGFMKDREGFFAAATGGRFRPEYQGFTGPLYERGQAIVANSWRQAGLDIQPALMPIAWVRDAEARNTFGAISVASAMSDERTLRMFASGDIGTAAKRWTGNNRGGWANETTDRLWDSFTTTLDRAERTRHIVGIAQQVSEDVPIFVLYANIQPIVHQSVLHGPDVGGPDTLRYWNIHEWEFK